MPAKKSTAKNAASGDGRSEQTLQQRAGNSVQQGLREGGLLALLALAAFLVLALASYDPNDPGIFFTGSDDKVANLSGLYGAAVAQFLLEVFGVISYGIPLLVALLPVYILRHWRRKLALNWLHLTWRFLGILLIVFAACALGSLHLESFQDLPNGAGGMLGLHFGEGMAQSLSLAGSTLVLLTILMFGISLGLGLSWVHFVEQLGITTLVLNRWLARQAKSVWAHFRRLIGGIVDRWRLIQSSRQSKRQKTQSVSRPTSVVPAPSQELAPVALPRPRESAPLIVQEATIVEPEQDGSPDTDTDQPAIKSHEQPMPAIDLLQEAEVDTESENDAVALQNTCQLLEQKLKDFNVQVEVKGAYPGPVITRLEVQPAAGVKASKISALAKDLARSLAVVSVRVVEVIPGKTVVGIEIPNQTREIVRLSEIIASDEYQASESNLTIALGKDIAGNPLCTDLARMPHLLVAGTTGSGKSVGVNAMLLSILFKATPAEVRLILVDPKMLELSVYEGIPHLLTPVITDMKEASNALNWCIYEMERRYRLMAAAGVRNLDGFNRKVSAAIQSGEPLVDPLWSSYADTESFMEALPLIVVVIDEFADMMMVVGKKVEELVVRLAQKARAAGIHLVLATQRPSVDVITGLIKANVPGRISFQVSSRVDSRTILDQGGAEQLLGHGDMLFMPPGTSMPVRIHGAFVEDEEVHRVADDWRQKSAPDYLPAVLSGGPPQATATNGTQNAEDVDELYDQAVACVIESRRASISSVQRKLRVGYNRAARLIEAMEEAGIVSTMDGAGNREILVPDSEGNT